MIRLLGVRPSKNPRKKYTAFFNDGSAVDFGGRGCGDFIVYWKRYGRTVALAKRSAYMKRHRVNETWLDPKAPGTLSRILLWEFRTLQEGIAKYDRLVQRWQKTPSQRYF